MVLIITARKTVVDNTEKENISLKKNGTSDIT